MRLCFDCHATNVAKASPLTLDGMLEGVQCERCHGPSDAHLRRQPDENSARSPPRNCPTSAGSAIAPGRRSPSTVRAASERPLPALSPGQQQTATTPPTRRIRCTACHDPHRDVETAAAAYDAKCGACHSRAAAAPCKVASSKDCVTCHMPRLELPGAHQKFTDHRIRIVPRERGLPGLMAMQLSRRQLLSLAGGAARIPRPAALPRRPCSKRSRRRRAASPGSTRTPCRRSTTCPKRSAPAVAFLDYDNDGWMDIYLVNSGPCDFYHPVQTAAQCPLQEQSRRHLHRRHRKGRSRRRHLRHGRRGRRLR